LFKSKRNRKQPGIPHPDANLAAIHASLVAAIEAVEMLQGQRGSAYDCAVTWGDLIVLGLVQEGDIPPDVGADRLRR